MTQELRQKIKDLPGNPGAYIFKDAGERIIYVGKANNIKKRVQSHFSRPEQHTVDFTPLVVEIDYIGANNENEALLLESQLIKKYQPRYNVAWKDDKDYFFVGTTSEKLPRLSITHRLENYERDLLVGPFMQGGQLRGYLRELRKLYPFRTCANLQKKPCMYSALGLCPGVCAKPGSKRSYNEILKALRVFLWLYQGKGLRIECYDISNLSGTLTVGSMSVANGEKADKSQYRKFRIKTIAGQNDVAALAEILDRRMKHDEWPKPDLIVLDGGKGQLKAARELKIPVVALAKTGGGRLFSRYSKGYVKISKLPLNVANMLLRVRDEAHRFAITYNKQRRQALIK